MDDREKAKKMLFPGIAVAGLIVLVAAMLLIGGGMGTEASKKDGSSPLPQATDLKIEDIKVGEGPEVQPGAEVTVHYVGTLTDGTVFDSSRDRGEPFSTPLDGVIQGWQRGIPGMKPGGIRKLTVPADLGYGPRRAGKIPPNSTLIFEVELISSK
jgi:FKBP-type peptidyl-prolyl cis-trans isomerase